VCVKLDSCVCVYVCAYGECRGVALKLSKGGWWGTIGEDCRIVVDSLGGGGWRVRRDEGDSFLVKGNEECGKERMERE
jgi:hypothetical protein